MFRSNKIVVFCLLLALILPGVVLAQPGGTHPAPSGSGGNVGGPGMSGAAFNVSMPEFSAPEIQQPDRSGGQTGGQNRTGGGVALPTLQPRGGTDRSFGGQNAEGAQSGDLASRFGSRGTGSFSLEAFSSGAFGDFQQSLQAGGFGTRSQGWSGREPGEHSFNLPTDELPIDLPDTPVALGDFSSLSEAQKAAQDSIDAAVQQASQQAQQTANSATQQAQAAYDQFWQDYYSAVDDTAQAYYDTVTASADYLLQSYEQAVDYTTDAIDYYIAYADQYAAYCALYPWDCYSYVYDAAESVYVYVGDVTVNGTTEIGDVSTSVSYPVQNAPAPSADAYEALVVFATDQLGAVVEPLYAGVATADVQALLLYLPAEIQAYFLNASTISGATYWGLMHGGAAAVSVGDCAANSANCAVSADNLSMQLSSASAGIYGLLTTQTAPAAPTDALSLITTVYPKLNGLSFTQISDVTPGYAFTASTASIGYDPATGQLISVAKVVYAGVVNVDGQAFVYALVALGEGYVGVVGN